MMSNMTASQGESQALHSREIKPIGLDLAGLAVETLTKHVKCHVPDETPLRKMSPSPSLCSASQTPHVTL